ncbi:transposase family protein [Streptomyces sp. NPDC051572]|uniref:transposase family protein n=1 Tax=unclassified Streptomyces TaxID=2593676 RepID=UPI00344F92DD
MADPRHRRGKRHSFVSVLLVACSAVLTGARSFAAIGQWAASAPQDALARLGTRAATVFDVRIAPSAATIRRVLNAACPGGLADLLGSDPASPDQHSRKIKRLCNSPGTSVQTTSKTDTGECHHGADSGRR